MNTLEWVWLGLGLIAGGVYLIIEASHGAEAWNWITGMFALMSGLVQLQRTGKPHGTSGSSSEHDEHPEPGSGQPEPR